MSEGDDVSVSVADDESIARSEATQDEPTQKINREGSL